MWNKRIQAWPDHKALWAKCIFFAWSSTWSPSLLLLDFRLDFFVVVAYQILVSSGVVVAARTYHCHDTVQVDFESWKGIHEHINDTQRTSYRHYRSLQLLLTFTVLELSLDFTWEIVLLLVTVGWCLRVHLYISEVTFNAIRFSICFVQQIIKPDFLKFSDQHCCTLNLFHLNYFSKHEKNA